ncbi:ferritin-like domain-containing protein [Brevibacillus dissolubilis]|uniref:ferritin-like domain-containing protein n=1 Tax=Brevibacillus dissolubilis TaxID=1844116 RepID=UPI001115D834|nr:ferritin-like domain-containing protein [Brevibacillus dissolubilis]
MNPYSYADPYSNPMMTPVRMDMNANNLNIALRGILQGISGERNDELFYDYLISVAPTQQEKQIITSIRNDERKHRRMFRQLYTALTGQQPPTTAETETFQRPASYLAGIEQALLGELRAFENYRIIYLNLPYPYRDIMFEIMTDEIKHASYYNWLYAKNTR